MNFMLIKMIFTKMLMMIDLPQICMLLIGICMRPTVPPETTKAGVRIVKQSEITFDILDPH